MTTAMGATFPHLFLISTHCDHSSNPISTNIHWELGKALRNHEFLYNKRGNEYLWHTKVFQEGNDNGNFKS